MESWPQPLDTPPFYAFTATCGITFTFGGLRTDEHSRVMHRNQQPIGGLLFDNYPGGTDLTMGLAFGRRVGHAAAARATGVNG